MFVPPQRFNSDPDKVATEKLAMTKLPNEYLESPYDELPAVIGSN